MAQEVVPIDAGKQSVTSAPWNGGGGFYITSDRGVIVSVDAATGEVSNFFVDTRYAFGDIAVIDGKVVIFAWIAPLVPHADDFNDFQAYYN